MTDYDYVMGPKYSLMRCYNYGKEWRVLGGFDLARLVKEPVSFSLRQGGPQVVISACVVTQIYRPSEAAGPADGGNRHQNDDDEQFVPSPSFEWNCCSGRIRSAHHSRIKSFPVVKHTPCRSRIMNHGGAYHEQQRTGIALPFLWPVLLGLIWICMILLANPIGDFPLNDDWAYAYSVQHLLQHGELRFSDWTATNLLGQVVWGALFCLPFGFSFTALRFSTAVLGFVGILGTYGILRELNASRQTAAVGALTLAFCPIYFVLSLTFMNDVPFVAFAIASLYFFMRGLRLESPPTIAVEFCPGWRCHTHTTDWTGPPDSFCLRIARKKGNSATLSLALLPYRGDWNWSSVRLPGLALSDRLRAGELQQANFYNFSQLTNAPAAHAS